MHRTPARILAHVDMDAFFASIEGKDHPEWKGDPIVVCVFSGRTPDAGVVSSASYDARKLGVKAAMPIVTAKQKCPQGHFVPVNHERYSQVSESVFLHLYPSSDSVEIASIDEAYADLTQKSKGDYAVAEQMLRAFQEKIKREFGLTCSIGMGPNKLVSKVASDFQKPNGCTVVKPEDVQSFLDPLSVKKLMGVGPKTEEELEKKGIRTILDLRLTSLQELVSAFGSAKGNQLFQYARGIDESPLQPERDRKQHSRITTLVQDASTLEEVRPLLKELVEQVWEETAMQGNFFTQLGVVGISARMGQTTKSKTSNLPFASKEAFLLGIEELFEQLFASAELPLRRIGVRVGGFASAPKQKRLGDYFS